MSLASNLYALGALMKDNLEYKGITGLTGNEGLTTLANKIRDITCKKEEENALILTFTGNSVSFGRRLVSNGEVLVDWGDGSTATIDNPTSSISHTYDDGLAEHTVVLTGEITSLGYSCFSDCSGLTSVIIPNSVTSLGNYCFENCSALTSVTIPDSVTNLGEACFTNCSGLTSVIIPNSVTNLGVGCFSDCSGLTSVIIPNSVTSLGGACFRGCSGLTSVIIPNSVTNLGEDCFWSCSGLIDYELYWESSPITYDSNKMPNNTNAIFTIPIGTTQLYIDAGYPSAKLRERHEYELYVTRDKKIIQTNEDVTLIGMLMRDGEAAVGETLTYQVLHEGSVVDSSSGVTDDNGLAEITYTGTGIGEVEITVKYGPLLQETFVLWDTVWFDVGVTGKKNEDWYRSNNNITVHTYDDGTLLESTQAVNIYANSTSNINRFLTDDFIIEFDVVSFSGNVNVRLASTNGNYDWQFNNKSITDGSHIKLEYQDGSLTHTVDDNSPVTTATGLNGNLGVSFRFSTVQSLKYKNYKIYSI